MRTHPAARIPIFALLAAAHVSACDDVAPECREDNGTRTSHQDEAEDASALCGLAPKCYIFLEHVCANDPRYPPRESGTNQWFEDTASERTAHDVGQCLHRAREWHAHCGFGSGTAVNAAWHLGPHAMAAQQVRGPGEWVYTYGANWVELPARSKY